MDSVGWDIGGAHLKVVRVDASGQACVAMQRPCPLWRGLTYLEHAIDQVLAALGDWPLHGITMTGELADIFPDRRTGVNQLVEMMVRKLPQTQLRIFAGRQGFVTPMEACTHALAIASANWLASAELVAKIQNTGVLVDVGSTTTDLIAFQEGRARPRGMTDAERLASGELVYRGVVRTPVMAVVQRVSFDGVVQRIAAEHFATMADVYRLTGHLDAAYDMAETADGAGKSLQDSARRLARMVGRDLQDAPMSAWLELAQHIAEAQLKDLAAALQQVAAQVPGPLVGAGAGRFLVRQLAQHSGRDYVDFCELVRGDEKVRAWAAVCAPAYAVARLVAVEGT
ncbi:MAG: S-layer protein [Methylophilaceae bacterium]|nr:S-layer protein [Methylophilaceae bacterium]